MRYGSYNANTPPSTAALSPPPPLATDGEEIMPIAKGAPSTERESEKKNAGSEHRDAGGEKNPDGPQGRSPHSPKPSLLHVSHSMVFLISDLTLQWNKTESYIHGCPPPLLRIASYCSQGIAPKKKKKKERKTKKKKKKKKEKESRKKMQPHTGARGSGGNHTGAMTKAAKAFQDSSRDCCWMSFFPFFFFLHLIPLSRALHSGHIRCSASKKKKKKKKTDVEAPH